jgi:2-isopropylmalate synthase
VQPNKAIVGANAFAHEAGIHQHGILTDPRTYEIMNAADIGLTESKLVLGKHSGRHAFRKKLVELGFELSPKDEEKAFRRFKQLADAKKTIYDEDIISIVSDETRAVPETYVLDYLHVVAGSPVKATATVSLIHGDERIDHAAIGVGPIDAVYRAIDECIGVHHTLVDFSVKSISGGTDALGEVTVKLGVKERLYTGRGSDTDILVSAAKAYVNALNKILNEVPAED